MSLPLRECGLKFLSSPWYLLGAFVTPLAGVWVEIVYFRCIYIQLHVTPLAGVWVEINAL